MKKNCYTKQESTFALYCESNISDDVTTLLTMRQYLEIILCSNLLQINDIHPKHCTQLGISNQNPNAKYDL